jgi:chloramphenicol 3-O phosphotransferase
MLPDAAGRLAGLPVLFVGVHCPIEVVMARRDAGQPGREERYETSRADGSIPEPVHRWQETVHVPGVYDLEVDTSVLTPAECAEAISTRLHNNPPPPAFRRLAGP